MTQIHSIRNLAAASTLGALTAVIMFAQSGTASAATSVLSCEGSTRSAVKACCEEQVQNYGLPLWMRQTHTNCSDLKIVRCHRLQSASKQLCRISKIDFDDSNDRRRNRDRGGRGNGGNGPKK